MHKPVRACATVPRHTRPRFVDAIRTTCQCASCFVCRCRPSYSRRCWCLSPPGPTPTDVKPGSITCDECPYPYPSKYLDISVYTQDVRIAYMDVAPQGAANGH